VNFSEKPTRHDDEVTGQEMMMDEIQGLTVSPSFSHFVSLLERWRRL
jgi:hypothetical protein